MSLSRWACAACALLIAASVGCGSSGPKNYPVSGTVTFDGKPVDGATVMFIPQSGRPGMGVTDASGKYTIATSGQPGAPTGSYEVTISKAAGTGAGGSATMEIPADPENVSAEQMTKLQADMSSKMREMATKKASAPKPGLPEKYSIPQGSGLTAKVTEDGSKNVFDFSLTP